mmetsp:Transcript_59946/g.168994  ORF Transcript_59946/g.168994 Transcript_59946/m.168994 type:complete len:329 (+) Transcript_59946:165-1151(+)
MVVHELLQCLGRREAAPVVLEVVAVAVEQGVYRHVGEAHKGGGHGGADDARGHHRRDGAVDEERRLVICVGAAAGEHVAEAGAAGGGGGGAEDAEDARGAVQHLDGAPDLGDQPRGAVCGAAEAIRGDGHVGERDPAHALDALPAAERAAADAAPHARGDDVVGARLPVLRVLYHLLQDLERRQEQAAHGQRAEVVAYANGQPIPDRAAARVLFAVVVVVRVIILHNGVAHHELQQRVEEHHDPEAHEAVERQHDQPATCKLQVVPEPVGVADDIPGGVEREEAVHEHRDGDAVAEGLRGRHEQQGGHLEDRVAGHLHAGRRAADAVL